MNKSVVSEHLHLDGAFCTVRRAIRKDTRQVFAAKYYKSEFLTAKN
jgi:hypothetical protein